MNKFKGLIKRIFNPPFWIILPLILISTLLLTFGFSEKYSGSAIAYVSYLVSSYTLVTVICALPKLFRSIKSRLRNSHIIEKINSHKLGYLFLNDIAFRGRASIYQGLLINSLYAVFRGITACIFQSVWFGAIAVYYLFLSIIRLFLVLYVRRSERFQGDYDGRMIFEFKGYRICGFLILLLNSAMAGMAVLMIRDNLHYEYPGYVIYLSAMYTFYSAITATVNIFKFRRLKSPILSASKAAAFTGAMMSVLALQTSMIAQFGGDDPAFRQIANTITGTVVCLGSVIIAFFMIFRGTYHIKKFKK